MNTTKAIIPCPDCWATDFQEERNRRSFAATCGLLGAKNMGHEGATLIELTWNDKLLMWCGRIKENTNE